ncbi:MAG: tyrosine--tRNA ligase, partial [Candidatus Paceibacterota bacterium]
MEKTNNELLTRGISSIYPNREFLENKIKKGEKLTIYLGIDPTGPTLHLGHAIPIKKLSELQKAGHKIILLMGDFTAMIGDPTDKGAARKQLTHKQVMTNLKNYKKQASSLISFTGKNPAQIKFNSKWLGKMNFEEVLSLASNMTVQQMLERDMFKKRVEEEKPIYLHEFMYPLMQGYDSVAMKVDGEIGGNDQTFNMLCGRDLMKTISGKEKFVITMKLLEDNSGKKMGKTEGNMIALSDTP